MKFSAIWYTVDIKLSDLKIFIMYNLPFVHVALKEAISENDSKLQAGNATDKTLYGLGWTIDELSQLNDECHTLYVEVTTLVERLEDEATDVVQMNAARLLNLCQEKIQDFVQSITRGQLPLMF